jgi:hypothetical protein
VFACLAIVAGALPVATATVSASAALSSKRLPARAHPLRYGTGSLVGALNWSGYAQTAANGTFTAIRGDVVVPTVDTALAGVQFSSDWLGIGGFNDSQLVQAGVEVDNLGGQPRYKAWTEVLPQPEQVLKNLKIHPGDKVVITVKEVATNRWKMTVADSSTGRSASRATNFTSSGASAEAIMERPCIALPCTTASDLADLASTTPAVFDQLSVATSTPSGSPAYQAFFSSPSGSSLQEIEMLDSSSNVIATPSDANAANDAFAVADGSSAPSPPSG